MERSQVDAPTFDFTLLSKLPYLPDNRMSCEPVAIRDTFDCGGIEDQLTFPTEKLPDESNSVTTICHVETMPEGVLHIREELDVQILAGQLLGEIFNFGLRFKGETAPNNVIIATADDGIVNMPGDVKISSAALTKIVPRTDNC